MRWLPARAYDNGVYYVFTNAVGVDDDTIKTGGAMILDPFGEYWSNRPPWAMTWWWDCVLRRNWSCRAAAAFCGAGGPTSTAD